ncbi:hypothetical protein MOQ_003851 [Trypanosoma cruzi marinkellei]|uniref:SET domain-containing protein n=1 Tax=Trypanosoma cruzi marinkellei TaxID=85056 RepID=K2MAX3_TRYCR|nr:hypothetical protein MOQ_003851 [Trypanosoma cruzi marinkellei]
MRGMPRVCLRCTRRGSLCRLTADAIGVVSVTTVTPSRYRSAHESGNLDSVKNVEEERGIGNTDSEPSPHRLHVGKARTAWYPRVRVAIAHHPEEEMVEVDRSRLDEEKYRTDAKGPSTESTAVVDEALNGQAGIGRVDQAVDEVQAFLREKQLEMTEAQLERNVAIPYPTHPDDMTPEFRRIKKHQSIVVVATDPDYPVFARRDQFVQLPLPKNHPWVKNTPIGPFIQHGDGQLGVMGSGEVGFDDEHVAKSLPHSFRGLRHRSVLQQRLPEKNGKVIQDAVVKNSFSLTGRGVFATRDIAAGENIMIVRNTACNLGVKGEVERLVEMCGDVLLTVYSEGTEAELDYLHDWILTGQPSSLLEFWPKSATERVLERIGGVEVLHALELHEIHIARLAAIIDMNSFLVESSYAVRKGMAYFPEAGFLNHSCAPNATYDIMPEHTFHESEYYMDEVLQAEASDATDPTSSSAAAAAATTFKEKEETVVMDEEFFSSKRTHPSNGVEGKENGVDGNKSTASRELTVGAPVQYLFCCRATANIPAGSEILISYVPPEWSFDNRQYVIHDRYRFWCKCPKCAPTLDAKYARVPQLIVVLLVFSVFLQLLVLHKRDVEQKVARENMATEEVPIFSSDNNDEDDVPMEQRRTPRQRSRGLFELFEEERLQEMYAPDRRPLPAVLANDPWARPPR